MRVWHDDVRRPPDDGWWWAWAKDNAVAKALLLSGSVHFISLDHDLGADPSDGIYAKGDAEDNGMCLVEWMIEEDIRPAQVVVHSWNEPAADRMLKALAYEGYNVRYEAAYPTLHRDYLERMSFTRIIS